jgi:hypothetical protein
MQTTYLTRRNFVKIHAIAGVSLMQNLSIASVQNRDEYQLTAFTDELTIDESDSPLENGTWYIANQSGEGITYKIEPGIVDTYRYLTTDILVDGNSLVVFHLTLFEEGNGRRFRLKYKGLNQAQARIRFPLRYVDQSRWRLEREGAWLKPTIGGERVDLSKVDRISFRVTNKSNQPARWCQTPLRLTKDEPELLQTPILPKGKLLDELGQSTIHNWSAKSVSRAEVSHRLNRQLSNAESKQWPNGFSRWGGWTKKKHEGTGFFTTHHDGKRWWLLDPDGNVFWSAGMDCVRPRISANIDGLKSALTWIPNNQFNGDYLTENLKLAFGANDWYDKWGTVVLSLLKEFGFNTVANWSNWDIAKKAGFPYVRPLSARFNRTPLVYRDFPDVFHPNFSRDADLFGKQLEETRDDPALIGYFLMNEPTWGFSSESPAMGMLYNTPRCYTRKELARFLERRYGTDTALSKTWGIKTTFRQIAGGKWTERFTESAKRDLYDFSEIMVTKFFQTISDSCKRADPNHLNLGIRYQGIPPKWCVPGMKSFDVFSMNCYRSKVPYETCEEIHSTLEMPVMIGEFHFGALDVGLPSPGLVHVSNQTDRGRAYRYYVEDAAANPYCVGVHYFTLYDQSALGRFDGENYNIGFLDICHHPYEKMVSSAQKCHTNLYKIAEGKIDPYEDVPANLPRLF